MNAAWEFLNSNIGLVLVASIIAWCWSALSRRKPAWVDVMSKHKPLFYDAVRYAEKAIPNDSESRSLQKLDAALQWVLKVEPKLASTDPEVLKKALSVAHDNQANMLD